MVDITKTVGDQGHNSKEDVALVQLMLRAQNTKIQNTGHPQITSPYNANLVYKMATVLTI